MTSNNKTADPNDDPVEDRSVAAYAGSDPKEDGRPTLVYLGVLRRLALEVKEHRAQAKAEVRSVRTALSDSTSPPSSMSGTDGTPNEVSSLRLALLAQVAALEGELRGARSGDPSRRFVCSSRREDAKRKQRDLVSLVVKSIQEYGPSAKVAVLKSPSGDTQFGDPLLAQVSMVSRVHSATEVACDLLKVLQEQADVAESALFRAREALSYYLSVFRDGTQRDLFACLDDRGTVAELGLTSVREVLHQQIAAARVLGEV